MTNEQWAAAQAEWSNPKNWRLGIYFAPRDPHVWVRKRNPQFGWTLNFGRRASWVWLAAFTGGVVAFALLRIASR